MMGFNMGCVLYQCTPLDNLIRVGTHSRTYESDCHHKATLPHFLPTSAIIMYGYSKKLLDMVSPG